jgi:hypothetical protein
MQKPIPLHNEKDDTAGTDEKGQTLPVLSQENPSGLETINTLVRLEAQMSDLSKDVTDIKQTLDTISESRQTVPEEKTGADLSPKQKKENLVLDFETFLSQRKKGGT